MVPLESPVREIRTPGSVSRGWKRTYGSRTERRRESVRISHRTLRAPRHLLTLLKERRRTFALTINQRVPGCHPGERNVAS